MYRRQNCQFTPTAAMDQTPQVITMKAGAASGKQMHSGVTS